MPHLSDVVYENAHVHILCMEIDSTVILVLFGIESYLAPLGWYVFWLAPQEYHRIEEALHSINVLEEDLNLQVVRSSLTRMGGN